MKAATAKLIPAVAIKATIVIKSNVRVFDGSLVGALRCKLSL